MKHGERSQNVALWLLRALWIYVVVLVVGVVAYHFLDGILNGSAVPGGN